MEKKTKKHLIWVGVIGILLMVFGIISTPNIPVLKDVVGFGQGQVQSFTTVEVSDSGGEDTVSDKPQLRADYVKLTATEKFSKNPNSSGCIEVYNAGVVPGSPSATRVANITLGTPYQDGLLSNKVYRLAYSNGVNHYAVDLGDRVLIPENKYSKDTGDAVIDLTEAFGLEPVALATLSDFLDETSTDGRINGQSNSSSGIGATGEIQCVTISAGACSADSVLTYNETLGDGEFYLDLTFKATGSNKALSKPVICFEHEAGAEPEGNEISSIVVQHQSGSTFDFDTGIDWAKVWQNQECVSAGAEMLSGTSAEYRFTFTVTEANYDTNDDFKLYFDDLGSYQGKDALLNLGATAEYVDFDNQG